LSRTSQGQTIATGDESAAEVGARVFELVFETATGRPTASEAPGFGEEEFVRWRTGVVK